MINTKKECIVVLKTRLEKEEDAKVSDRRVRVQDDWKWEWNWRRQPRGRELGELEDFLARSQHVKLSENKTDKMEWTLDTSKEYSAKKMRIKTILKANEVWEMIEPLDNKQPDEKKDMAATVYLFQALPEEMVLQVASCKSANEIWEALQIRHIGVERMQKARLQTLKTEFKMLKMKEDDSIDVFSAKLNIQVMGNILRMVDKRSLGHLRITSKTKDPNHLTNGKKFSHKSKKDNFQKGAKDLSKVKCYKCNKFGHIRRNCKLKDNGQEQSNLIQEDMEPTLLMAVQGKGDKVEEIFLDEKEIEPEKYISTDESLWYMDNGASNHMTGVRAHFTEIDERMSGRDQKLLMRVERSRNRLHNISLKVGVPIYLLTNLEDHAWLWHVRLGHLNFDSIKQMTHKKLVEGIASISHKNQVCNACLLGKHSRAPFPNQTNTKSIEPLNLVFGDLCGPISPATESGKKYMFLLIDDCTRYMWVYFLNSKDETFETFKEIKLKVENEVGKKLKTFRTNRSGEFTSREFTRTQDSERNDEVSTPSPMQNNAQGDMSDDEIVQPLDNPSTPPPYTYEPNSEEFVGYTSSIASSSRLFDHMPVRGGKIIKYKARLVAKGYVQEHGINYDEVFALLARMETVRLILALAAYHGWKVRHLDVKSTFLHRELKEEVYVTQPEGFIKPGNENKVYRLVKALYGLKQAPRAWNMKGWNLNKAIRYANKILKEARMLDCNETNIPMDPRTNLIKTDAGELVDAIEYRSLIGCLRYLLHTRSDLSYSVVLLSRFMQEPKEQHMKAIRHVLCYIKGTLKFGITYKKKGGCKLHEYSDSTYGINTEESKGTTWIIFYLGNSSISWNYQKQPTVALSSCWKEERVTINKLAIALMKNPVFHGRIKFIDIRYHFIRECVEKNLIEVEHVSGDLQRADILTKALVRIKFAEMRELLGVKGSKGAGTRLGGEC
ncbi:hypothetical protein OSB04_016510 [Centaurea solstitialis]|uniref:CCHC-type domain-containing protein n=1 Tax=Centaurea solstitialis TaxID=347529 RepID=A0AA38T134_9ASTR|nr:hypothetical protein OSB04_016510 [Centaurea solstitialis]